MGNEFIFPPRENRPPSKTPTQSSSIVLNRPDFLDQRRLECPATHRIQKYRE